MKPFPFVLGTDIVHLVRWEVAGSPIRIVRLAQRILHPKEYASLRERHPDVWGFLKQAGLNDNNVHQACCKAQEKPATDAYDNRHISPKTLRKVRNYLGGRWAAKEAARKAWGATLLGFKDIRVTSENEGSERSTATSAVKVLCQPCTFMPDNGATLPSQEGRLSISHDGDYAVATVVAEPLSEEIKGYLQARLRSTSSALPSN